MRCGIHAGLFFTWFSKSSMVCQFCLEIYAEMMFLLFEISFKLHNDKLYTNFHQVAYSALNIFVFGHEIKGYRKKGGWILHTIYSMRCCEGIFTIWFMKWKLIKSITLLKVNLTICSMGVVNLELQ